jgi:predicted ATPase/transcriptional regulator with XRE-family HTH domain
MPRTQSSTSPIQVTTFGELLKYLRRRARMTQQDLSIATGYSVGQICRLEQNQRLPDVAAIAALFIPALDLHNEPALAAQLLELAAAARGESLAGHSVTLTQTTRHQTRETTEETVVPAVGQDARPLTKQTPLRTRPVNNLPAAPTPLFGRHQDVTMLLDLLLRADTRLLTITGAPGVGKTRLVLAAAQTIADAPETVPFPAGIFFVSLAPVRQPTLVLPAIARALGLTNSSNMPIADVLAVYLREKRLLLILDNFEQILPAGPAIAELLATCPLLKILVTSREPLRLRAERRLPLAPLALPELAALSDVATLAENPAVALFVERAEAVLPTFRLTDENAAAVAAICVRLDGLPLALELVAARIETLPVDRLLEELTHRLALLTDGPADLPARQQTLHNAIAWSYELLDPAEQQLFVRLGIFAGGCTVAAATAICQDVASAEEIPMLTRLLNMARRSLVQQQIVAGETRFLLLETLRAYSLEQLQARGDLDTMQRRHLSYFQQFCAEAWTQMGQPDELIWLSRFQAENANLHEALDWVTQSPALPKTNVETGIQLGSQLVSFWFRLDDLYQEFAQITALLVLFQRAHENGLLPSLVTVDHAKLLNSAGLAAYRGQDASAGRAFFEQSLVIYRQLDHKQGIANVVNNLGVLAREQGDYATARAYYVEDLALERESADSWGIALSRNNLAVIDLLQGNLDAAWQGSEESLRMFHELGDPMGIAECTMCLGMIAHERHDDQTARQLFEDSLVLLQAREGDKRDIVICLTHLAEIAQQHDDVNSAGRHLVESIQVLHRWQDGMAMAECLMVLAEIYAHRGQAQAAAKLLGVIDQRLSSMKYVLYPRYRSKFTALVTALPQQMGEQAFQEAWAVGSTLRLEQALADALILAQVIADGQGML